MQVFSQLLRNCGLEQLSGLQLDEREAHLQGATAQTAQELRVVLGIVRLGARILVAQVALERAVDQDRQCACGGGEGFRFPVRAANRR